MKIGVVADTHSKDLPKQMLDDFKSVDFIIHAGDFCSLEDYRRFAKIKKVKGVQGNMDDSDIQKLFPLKQIFKVEQCQVGLFHGEGSADNVVQTVQAAFKDYKVDIVIFGHSHYPMNEKIKNIIYFNPGSPNDEIFAPYCSYGILNIIGKEIDAQIIKVK